MNKSKIFQQIFLLFLLAFVSFAVQAQTETAAAGNPKIQTGLAVQDLKLKSGLMAREMPYRVILPPAYETEKNEKYPVVYLLHGLTGHFNNWDERTKLKDYAANYRYILVMAEGDNGWYTDSATVANDKYESYIVKELIPEIEKKYRTFPDRDHRAIAGLSMGGYGSLKFGLKYPEMFSLVGSFSGALAAAGWTQKQFDLMKMKGPIPDSIKSVYGADDSQTRATNDIYKMVREITPEKIKALPFIYQSCGTEDFLIQNNHEFAALLFEKKIPHEYREHPGIHDWKFWDDQINEFLELSGSYFKTTPAKAP